MEIPITPRDALQGGHVRILVPARARCPLCHGYGAVDQYECWQCQGQGAITGEFPLELELPPDALREHSIQVPLSEFGIENFYLTVRFRVTG